MKHSSLLSALVAAAIALPLAASAQEERILWISIGDSPTNLSGLTTKINAAHADGFNAVCFLSRYRSNAYYIPNRTYSTYYNPEPTASGVTTSNDPTQHVIDIAKPLGMRVYAAWPSFIVTDGTGPSLPAHIDAGWVQHWYSGSTQNSYTPDPGFPKAIVPADVPDTNEGHDGIWIDPGVPAARTYTINVLLDFLQNYDVDGVVFDRVRFPGDSSPRTTVAWGYNPTALAAYGLSDPAPNSAGFISARRGAVTAFLTEASAAVRDLKPWVITAAAPVVYGSTLTSTYDFVFQHFPSWNTAANAGHTSGFGAIDAIMPQYYRSLAATNVTLIDLAKPDVTNIAHQPLFRSFTVTGDTDLAAIGARAAINVCDTRDVARGTVGSGFFAASVFQNATFGNAFDAEVTSCGANVYGTPATPYQYTLKTGWDGVAPNAVSTLAAVGSEARITLSWSTPAPAADSDVPQEYLVYRSTTSPVARTWANLVNKNFSVRGNQFIDQPNTGLSTANTYFYAVVSVDDYNNKSALSNETSAAVTFSSSIAKARDGAPGYTDNFTGTQNSSANSAAPGNTLGGSRFSTVIGQVGTYRPAIASAGFYEIDITTDNQSSHNANASWALTAPSETRNSSSNFLIRGTSTGNIGDVWAPIITPAVYFNSAAAGSSSAVLALTNVDGNDLTTARFNLDALRLRRVDGYPIRSHGAKFNASPSYTFKSASGGSTTINLSGVTADGYIEYSEANSHANTVGLDTAKLMNRKYTITAGSGLAFTGATITLSYSESDLNGLTEIGTSLNTVWKSNGVVALPVNSGDVSFNYAANTVTISNQTGFSDWFLGDNDASVTEWMLLND